MVDGIHLPAPRTDLALAELEPADANVLYRFFDADRTLLYIGISARLNERWRQHSREKGWFRQIRSATIEHYDSRAEVEAAEIAAIKAEGPKWNDRHNNPIPISLRRTPRLTGLGDWLSMGEIMARVKAAGLPDSESTIRRTVDKLAGDNTFTSYRTDIGGYRRIKAVDIDAWIAGRLG